VLRGEDGKTEATADQRRRHFAAAQSGDVLLFEPEYDNTK